jgi:hypothetical protein
MVGLHAIMLSKVASMKSMFPWLKPLLLPYAWLLRAIRAVRHRKGNLDYITVSQLVIVK